MEGERDAGAVRGASLKEEGSDCRGRHDDMKHAGRHALSSETVTVAAEEEGQDMPKSSLVETGGEERGRDPDLAGDAWVRGGAGQKRGEFRRDEILEDFTWAKTRNRPAAASNRGVAAQNEGAFRGSATRGRSSRRGEVDAPGRSGA